MKKWYWFVVAGIIAVAIAVGGCGREKTPDEIRAVVEKSVVLITYGEGEKGHGTGFFVQGEAGTCTVLTAAHVVRGSNQLLLTDYRGKLIAAAKGAQPKYLPDDRDLAVVTFLPDGGTCPYAALKLGNSDTLKWGERVRVFGYPQRLGEERLTPQFPGGEITNIQKPPLPEGYAISYDANAFGGMSGAPVVNTAGEVIAVHGKADLAKLSQQQKAEIESQLQANIETFRWGIPINTYIENARLARSGETPLETPPAPPPVAQSTPSTPQSSLQSFASDTVTVNARGEKINSQRYQAQYFSEDLGNGVTMDMVSIPEGNFLIGSPESEEGRSSDESPQHRVTVAPFYMGKYTVTQAQWRAVAALPQVKIPLKPDPSYFKGDNLPVEQVSWEEAVEFCARLSKKTGRDYRLPSEAEWEYAARAGTTTPFYFGETITPDLVNYDGNYPYASAPKGTYREKTTPVGSFPPNPFGLYDMHGNVWQWLADSWHDNYNGAPSDGSVWESGGNKETRVLRGGSWFNNAVDCRSANRSRNSAGDGGRSYGFRVAVARLLPAS